MASTSAPAIAFRVAPQRAAGSFASPRSLAGYRAVVCRCWGAGRGRRRRWAGLRARCGRRSPAVQPDSQNSGKGLVAEEGGEQRPPFDLNLAVVLAGFAFEAYTSPPADVGWREMDAAECQTVFLSDVFLREVYDGQLVVKLKKGVNLPALDPWGTSDPYVVLQLNGQTAKSNIKWATKEPTWNETFTFNIRKSRENLLQVAAWDANLVTPHKRMGYSGLYLESLCDGNNHEVTVDLEGLGGGGTIELEVKYKSYDDIEREKQWWRIPFVSDFLVKSSLGSALRTILGSESINASQFVKSAFGQLSSFTYTYLPKPSSLDGSKNVEESPNKSIGSNELQQQKIDYGDNSDSHNDTQSPAATVSSEENASSDVKESDEYFWRALNNVLNQNVLQNFGFSLPEVKQLDGFDLLSSIGLKSREIAEQKYLESGLAKSDTSTSNGSESETASEDAVAVDDETGTLATKKEVQASFPDISKVSRDVLSQTENILGALMILSKNFSPEGKESTMMNETNTKDEIIKGQQGAAAADSIDEDSTVACTEKSIHAQKAEDMRQLFASAETAMEAWAMLATSLGRNSFIKSDFEKICFLDNISTDTQVAIWRDSMRRRLVVAFRGTEQSRWKDLRTDLMLVPAGLNPERLGGDFKQEVQVHSGFLGAYDSVRNRIMALIKCAIGYQDEGTAEIIRWHVYVTGHSLGGALATLLALELSSSQMAKNGAIFVTMYNFGSPRVGNRKFAEVYNAKVKDSWRIVNHRDIVPTVPRLMGYCHVEAPVYLKFGDVKDALVNNETLDDEDQGDEIGEYTPDILVSEFMKGEKQLVEKLLQTEINLLRSIRDGSALMQHMEDFYYVTLLENVRSRYQTVDSANDEYRQLTA